MLLSEYPDIMISEDSDDLDSTKPCAIAVLLILLGGLPLAAVPPVPATDDPATEEVGNEENGPEPSTTPQVASEDAMDDQPDIPQDKKKEESETNKQETVVAIEFSGSGAGEGKTLNKVETKTFVSEMAVSSEVKGVIAPDSPPAAQPATESQTGEQRMHYHAYYALGFGIFTAELDPGF